MKRLRSKMTTEELANCLGVARQTVNRWIREQKWETEKFPGVKGGRARLVHIDSRVREFILNIPAFRNHYAFYQAEEPLADYHPGARSHAFRQIVDAVENMSETEQEKLALFLSREGIRRFLARLGIEESEAQ
ncbi:MerR family transcriptional regulator [Citrobacter sedlakii]|uniref:MerR family transcriptional regulator n=1 Tax=Citrobacter sedlakii TaxID=67826 RepID=UPI003B42902A